MPYAESLRAIGQSLEMVHIESFRLEKEGDSYVVRSESLTPARLWILSNSLAEDVRDSPPLTRKPPSSLWVRDGSVTVLLILQGLTPRNGEKDKITVSHKCLRRR